MQKDDKIKELQELVEIYKRKDEEEAAKKIEDKETERKEAEMREQIRQQELKKERLAKEREEMERVQKLELEKKMLEEKYKEKLDKRKRDENKENESVIRVNESSNRIPHVNRANKPKIPEIIRHFNGVRGNVVSLKQNF